MHDRPTDKSQKYIVWMVNIYIENINIQKCKAFARIFLEHNNKISDKKVQKNLNMKLFNLVKLIEHYKETSLIELENGFSINNHFNFISQKQVIFNNIQNYIDESFLEFNNNSQDPLFNELISLFKNFKNDGFEMLIDEGQCNGMNAWWGYKMSERTVENFYNIIDGIAACNSDTYSDTKNKILENAIFFEKFLSHIHWLQNPYQLISQVQQEDLDYILEINKICLIPKKQYIFSDQNIIKLLTILPSEKICNFFISGTHTGRGHTVSVYRRDDIYYLYDSNDESGRPAEFSVDKLNDLLSVLKSIGDLKNNLEIGIYENPGIHEDAGTSNDTYLIELLNLLTTMKNVPSYMKKIANAQFSALQVCAQCIYTLNLKVLKEISNVSNLDDLPLILQSKEIINLALVNRNYCFINFLLVNDKVLHFNLNQKIEIIEMLQKALFSPLTPIYKDAYIKMINLILNTSKFTNEDNLIIQTLAKGNMHESVNPSNNFKLFTESNADKSSLPIKSFVSYYKIIACGILLSTEKNQEIQDAIQFLAMKAIEYPEMMNDLLNIITNENKGNSTEENITKIYGAKIILKAIEDLKKDKQLEHDGKPVTKK